MPYSCKKPFSYRARSHSDHNPPLSYHTQKFYRNKKDTNEKTSEAEQIELIRDNSIQYGPYPQPGL